MASFNKTALFGGAITVDLPSRFLDVSNIRQVPDHQEVYLDSTGLTSIIIEITQRAAGPGASTDEEALQYHYHDACSDAQDSSKIWQCGTVILSKMPNIPAYGLLGSQQLLPGAQTRGPQPDFTGTLLLLLRLEEKKTDILITINVPHVPGEYNPGDVDLPGQKLGKLLSEAATFRQRILETFEIQDWTLFVDED